VKNGKSKNIPVGRIPLTPGSDAHSLVVRLIKAGVGTKTLAASSGQPVQAIAAIRAWITMGRY
jgi:hypothetical protein